jgi:ADP-ribosylglycohydrolase
MDLVLFGEGCRVTDDSVLTLAVAEAILDGEPYGPALRRWGWRYPSAGYGSRFVMWLMDESMGPYQSFGNGAAMRVSAVGFAFDTVEKVLAEARLSAEPTHDHPEGVKGAQATALAVFLARNGESKDLIRRELTQRFGYDLTKTCDQIRPEYGFELSCQKTVPQALIAFFDSTDYEHAIRLALSLGGDADTLACITGGIAQAFYHGVPSEISQKALSRMDAAQRGVLDRFEKKFMNRFTISA